jgi:hypothetical protein
MKGEPHSLCAVKGILKARSQRAKQDKLWSPQSRRVDADKTQSTGEQAFYFRRLEDLFVLLGDNFTTLLLRQM